jgi:hypothetical protein
MTANGRWYLTLHLKENELITDTENAIRHLDTKIQNTFRYLATREIKQIIETNPPNTIHKRHQHTI